MRTRQWTITDLNGLFWSTAEHRINEKSQVASNARRCQITGPVTGFKKTHLATVGRAIRNPGAHTPKSTRNGNWTDLESTDRVICETRKFNCNSSKKTNCSTNKARATCSTVSRSSEKTNTKRWPPKCCPLLTHPSTPQKCNGNKKK